MIDVQDILNATNQGLDVILSYYPQARQTLDTKKPFCLRNERTPSAYLKQFGNVWKVTDFGDDAHARNCFDVVQMEENIQFKEALFLLADRYNVSAGRLNQTVNKPEIRQRQPSADEPEGHFAIEYKKEWSQTDLDVFGPRVEQRHVDELSYKSVAWFSKTKKNKSGQLLTTITTATDTYPIFARECGEFRKIYQPLNPDKGFRFFYDGTKPKDFINGLQELRLAYTKYNEQERNVWESNPMNEERPYKDKKLEAAVICSGERDAVNCLSFGYKPIWLNSESAVLDETSYREISRMVEAVYNIPDIDVTGIRKGIELGLRYLDIRTVKLPEWLRTYKDMRGRPRKDLRDFLEIRSRRSDFENLIKLAMPYKFWEWTDTRTGKTLEINTAYLLNFLADAGFGKIQDPITKKETLVHVQNSVVREVTNKDIRAYIVDFVRKNVTDIQVINLVLNSKRTSTVTMDDLNKLDIDFTDNEEFKQFMFFQNKSIEITPGSVLEYRPGELDRFVWESHIIPQNFKRTDRAFEIKHNKGIYSLSVKNTDSHYFRYLINSSRVYWRRELEERATGNLQDDAAYFNDNHFNIRGPRLNAPEYFEQEQNLISKIFSIGYMMHRYKALSKPWAVWVMEDKVSEDGQSMGGTGKSFMIKFLSNFKPTVRLGGRNKKLTENVHIFERVTRETAYLFIDDAHQYIDFDFFFDSITGGMDVNEKHVKSSELTYEESPKIIFTSNYPPRGNDSATSRRLLYVVFSDWYHEANEDNDYRETRSIRDDFGYDLAKTGYKPEYWNQDINFLVDCLQFYLSLAHDTIKLQPPMKKVYERMNIATMGSQFQDWAEVYFSENSANVDVQVLKEMAIIDFIQGTNLKGWSSKQFTKALRAFCKNAPHVVELNPKELTNSGNRIINTDSVTRKTKEYIYIRTFADDGITPKELNTLPF